MLISEFINFEISLRLLQEDIMWMFMVYAFQERILQ